MDTDTTGSEYPTHEQMKEMWDAYKSGIPGAMADVLRKREREREERKDITEAPSTDGE